MKNTKNQNSRALSISLYDNPYAIENLQSLLRSYKNIVKVEEMKKEA